MYELKGTRKGEREREDPMVVNIHVVHNERRTRSSLKPFAAAEKKRKKIFKRQKVFFFLSQRKKTILGTRRGNLFVFRPRSEPIN